MGPINNNDVVFFFASDLKIIIMSCFHHRYPWPFLATPFYRLLVPASLHGYILYWHRVVVYIYWSPCFCCIYMLLLYIYVGHLAFARPCEGVHWSTSLMIIQWICQEDCTAAALWGVASRTCSILLAKLLCRCRKMGWGEKIIKFRNELNPNVSLLISYQIENKC